MSIARREPQWKRRSLSWAGHAVLVQRHTASPSTRSAAPPQAGQWVGMWKGSGSGSGRLEVTTCTRYGITSPARSISTVSPTRTSLRRTSSSLCRLTLETVTPASSTGSSWAVGVSAPDLPTLIVIETTRVVAWRAANL